MKNTIFSTIVLFFFALQLNAQTQGVLWAGSRSGNAQANAVHAAITTAYDAFIAGDAKGWDIYTNDAVEVDPTGNVTFGKKNLLEGWEAFMKMTDEAPKFSYGNVQVRMLTNDVALALIDTEADIKVGGQQMGGKSKCLTVLRKVNGAWKIEADQLTPVLAMPGN